jgi:hypothetical protein
LELEVLRRWLRRCGLKRRLQGPSAVAFAENSFDGRNLLSLVSGKTPAWREFIDPPLPALSPTNFR